MQAKQALAFAARRSGTSSMDEGRWRHVLSLELGWMPPGQAARYVTACRRAGLFEPDGDVLRLTFDPKSVDIPRGFRPDPDDLPAGPEEAPATQDVFAAWLPKVAAARQEDLAQTMEEVERLQEAAGGLLHAEPALLRLGAEAGLDVQEAAAEALSRLRA